MLPSISQRPSALPLSIILMLFALVTFSDAFPESSRKHVSKGHQVASRDASRDEGIRVLIVGDSMTHGFQGDHTWRYRIWEWFRDQGIAVTLVGPYTGTWPPADAVESAGLPQPNTRLDPERTFGLYAKDIDPAFQKNHFAVAGRVCAIDKNLIETVVTDYPADMILLMLGFNDFAWKWSDVPILLKDMEELITNARKVNPKLKWAFANIPMRTKMDGRPDLAENTDEYNALLPEYIKKWSTVDSPIELVNVRENYSCDLKKCPAGWDGLHPDALGEYEIAHAFSLTLISKFGIGETPAQIPSAKDIPPRPLPVPSNFVVHTSPGVIFVTWDHVFGAYDYDIEVEITGDRQWIARGELKNRYEVNSVDHEREYRIRVRACAGRKQLGEWTPNITTTAIQDTNTMQRILEIATTSDG